MIKTRTYLSAVDEVRDPCSQGDKELHSGSKTGLGLGGWRAEVHLGNQRAGVAEERCSTGVGYRRALCCWWSGAAMHIHSKKPGRTFGCMCLACTQLLQLVLSLQVKPGKHQNKCTTLWTVSHLYIYLNLFFQWAWKKKKASTATCSPFFPAIPILPFLISLARWISCLSRFPLSWARNSSHFGQEIPPGNS